MKNFKISLLAAGATIALLACSSLEVSNPEAENFPADWSVAEYMKANPDLRALQIKDQVLILNTLSGLPADTAKFMSDTVTLKKIALEYAGFTEASFNLADDAKRKYIKTFDINGVDNEPAVFDTLKLDTALIERQYVVYGKIEGRPYRRCGATDVNLVKKGDCQAEEAANVAFSKHLYCALEGVTYCIDCDKVLDDCPEVIIEPEQSSSSAAAPESSEAAVEGDSSSSVVAEGDSSSSEAAAPESSEGAEPEPESSSATEPAAESSSSVTE